MKELHQFGALSNFKINYSKSEILTILLSPSLADSLQAAFPFTWAKSSIKYLGIQLTDRFETLYHSNYPSLLAAVHNDLKHWTKTAFTWLERVNIIKMNILRQVLFYLQMCWCLCQAPFPQQSQACFLNLCGMKRDPT